MHVPLFSPQIMQERVGLHITIWIYTQRTNWAFCSEKTFWKIQYSIAWRDWFFMAYFKAPLRYSLKNWSPKGFRFLSTEDTICHTGINRGSYMNAHVLLNLLNELGKRDKMRGLPSILSLFRNEFNKFNSARARMLDSLSYDKYFEIWFLA